MQTAYVPVQWVYREVIEEEVTRKTSGKVFYFADEKNIEEATGSITEIKEITGEGVFIFLNSGARVRVDRIITLFGKPGAAFDEYDAYANACMDCMGGYEKEDLD